MLAKELTSLQHPIVKHLVKLKSNKDLRRVSQTVLVMGKKMVFELVKSLPIKILLTNKKDLTSIKAEEHYFVTDEILKKITGLQSPDGMAAVVALPQEQDLTGKHKILVLNNLSDPGNVGTLFRTALGLGWEGIYLTPQTVDPFNDKALRAAKGATFHLPFCYATEEEIIQIAEKHKSSLFVTAADGKSIHVVKPHKTVFLVLGSEAKGHGFAFEKKGTKVSLPMSSAIESYNVAIAGAMFLYALRAE